MKYITNAITILWLLMLMTPSAILSFKLTKYLIDTNFHEWHITILWSLSFPISFVIFSFGLKRINGKSVEVK